VMIINMQAFAARGEDARRIYMELDDFQSRRPIDVIKKNRPIHRLERHGYLMPLSAYHRRHSWLSHSLIQCL